jgi:hypothetical protein
MLVSRRRPGSKQPVRCDLCKGSIACRQDEERAEEKTRKRRMREKKAQAMKWEACRMTGEWSRYWGGLLGHDCQCDFNEMALDHGDALGSHEGDCRQLTVPQRLRNRALIPGEWRIN